MLHISKKTGLYQANNIYEVIFSLEIEHRYREHKKKNHGVTGVLFSVGWIENEQQSPFPVEFSQKTGLHSVNNIYHLDLFV